MSGTHSTEKTDRDRELAARIDLTLQQVEEDAVQYEADDLTGLTFGQVSDGPAVRSRTRRTTISLSEGKLIALDRLARREGISRTTLIRRAVSHELTQA